MSFNSDIEKFVNDVKFGLKNLTDASANDGLNIVKGKTPVRTGHLRDSWKIIDGFNGPTISNDVYYGIFVEDGTEKMHGHFMVRRTLFELTNNIKAGKYNK
jgi:hypothetical protein